MAHSSSWPQQTQQHGGSYVDADRRHHSPQNVPNGQQHHRSGSRYGTDSTVHPHQPHPHSVAGHKRKLEALRGPPLERTRKPPLETAPAVPRFGAPVLDHDRSPVSQAHQTSKRSLFGLHDKAATDINDSDSGASDDDLDEEETFAHLGTKLVFEYEGQVVKLNSEADLARWQEERKRRWPSNARVTEKEAQRRTTGDRRKRLLEPAYALRQPGFKFRSSIRWDTQRHSIDTDAKLSTTKDAERPAQPANITTLPGMAAYGSDESDTEPGDPPATSPARASNEDTPEQLSTKGDTSMSQPACKYFFHNGKCRDGDQCAYRHEAQPGRPIPQTSAAQRRQQLAKDRRQQPSAGRKGIHQLLVDQEGEAGDRLALQVIKYLGGVGFFDHSELS